MSRALLEAGLVFPFELRKTLAAAAKVPTAPIMTPLTSSTNNVLVLGLTSNKQSLMQLRTTADWTIRPRLLAAPGVASVTVFGGESRQIQVQFHPEKLVHFNLSLSDVIAAAQKATGIQGPGFIENGNQRLILQSEGQFLTPEQIAATVLVRQNGANVTLAQVPWSSSNKAGSARL